MVFKLDDSCSLEQNSDKLLIRGMEPAEQSKPSETLLPANYHCHCQLGRLQKNTKYSFRSIKSY